MTPLRHRMTEDMVIRNLAENTQAAYLQQITAYAEHFHRSPEDLGPEAIRAYQLYLTQTRKLSASSVSVATGALRFLYKVTLKRDWAVEEIPMPKRPFILPVILSREEVMHFLDSVDSLKHRTILTTAYAAGLRVTEATRLKVTDIDSGRMMLRVDQGKPSMLKSGYHEADFYRAMWKEIILTGAWQGEIWDRRKDGEVYPKWLSISAVKADDGVVTHYVGSHLDITDRKRADEQIKHLAFYDHLTGLPNRRLLLDRLQQAQTSNLRTKRNGALLFIDLDNFKTLNDTLGHQIGDQLLQQVAQRLESTVREGDTVARLGGDEFVVVLENLNGDALVAATQAEVICKKIFVTLNHQYHLGAHVHQNTPSIGIAMSIDHQLSSDELFKQADLAMYQAKKAGRNTYRFFDPKMQESINTRLTIEVELRKAVENHEFHLYYQAQVDSKHRVFGAEALIRWISPERGMVSPAQFIPLAEESELIVSIGGWVLETACAQLREWQKNELTRNLLLSINVSAKQFHQADFVDQVRAAIQRCDINPQLLKLELTESMLLENIEEIIATMNALKAIGVRISLDDFGTGYSSLQYLKRLPLSQLKIDQSFVRDLVIDESDKAIAQTIIAMARSLRLDVIAEGVETEEQRLILESAGCRHYQGYLFGKPIPIEKFEALVRQSGC